MYRRIEAVLRSFGEFRIHPQRTRIAFISRMSFAGVRLAERWVDLAFILAEPVEHQRIRRIELYGPTSFGHHTRIARPEKIDADVRSWLRAAWRRGRQETLDRHAHVRAVRGLALARLVVPLAARVAGGADGPALSVPRYAAEALQAHPTVVARIKGRHHRARLQLVNDGAHLLLEDTSLAELGIDVDDRIDVRVTPEL